MMAFGRLQLLSFDYIIRAPAICDTMVAVVVMVLMVAGRMMNAKRMSESRTTIAQLGSGGKSAVSTAVHSW
jgi:hypothetical protein